MTNIYCVYLQHFVNSGEIRIGSY